MALESLSFRHGVAHLKLITPAAMDDGSIFASWCARSESFLSPRFLLVLFCARLFGEWICFHVQSEKLWPLKIILKFLRTSLCT